MLYQFIYFFLYWKFDAWLLSVCYLVWLCMFIYLYLGNFLSVSPVICSVNLKYVHMHFAWTAILRLWKCLQFCPTSVIPVQTFRSEAQNVFNPLSIVLCVFMDRCSAPTQATTIQHIICRAVSCFFMTHLFSAFRRRQLKRTKRRRRQKWRNRQAGTISRGWRTLLNRLWWKAG